jgi:predicted metal-dependent enzyme (double-stranded beta helix superfamily)
MSTTASASVTADIVEQVLRYMTAQLEAATDFGVALRRAADQLGSWAAEGGFDCWLPVDPVVPVVERLGIDDPTGIAVYLVVDLHGERSDPHEHLTWSITVGLTGSERNAVFTRAAGGEAFARCTEQVIGRGDTLVLLDHQAHSTEALGDGSSCHLHVYGQALETLPPFNARLIPMDA